MTLVGESTSANQGAHSLTGYPDHVGRANELPEFATVFAQREIDNELPSTSFEFPVVRFE